MITNYKQLQDYRQNRTDFILKDNKVFFAFSMEQFQEGIKEINLDTEKDKLSSLGMGGYLPSKNLEQFKKEMEILDLECQALVISNPALKKELIKYELANYEAYYCYDSYYTAIENIKSLNYGITDEEIQKVYLVESKKYEF